MSNQVPTVKELFEDGRAIDNALREAARDARGLHKALGNPMVTWKDGRVVWVQPEDVQVERFVRAPYGEDRMTLKRVAAVDGAARRLSARKTASSTRSSSLPTSSARKRRTK